jgi:hypothetical protein
VNRFSARSVKGVAGCAATGREIALGSCHGVAGWHGGRCN